MENKQQPSSQDFPRPERASLSSGKGPVTISSGTKRNAESGQSSSKEYSGSGRASESNGMGSASISSGTRKQSGQEQSFRSVKGVERIKWDNFYFRFARKVVFGLDNFLFNHNGSAGPGYQPTRYALVAPFWFAVLGPILGIIVGILASPKNEDFSEEKFIVIWGTVTLLFMLINTFFSCRKNVSFFRDRPRKILYPIFLFVSTMIFFYITSLLFLLLIYVIIVIVVLWVMVVFLYHFILAMLGASASSSSSGRSGGDPITPTESCWIPDGTVMGKTLTKEGGSWKDSSGNRYEEDLCGFLHKS